MDVHLFLSEFYLPTFINLQKKKKSLPSSLSDKMKIKLHMFYLIFDINGNFFIEIFVLSESAFSFSHFSFKELSRAYSSIF